MRLLRSRSLSGDAALFGFLAISMVVIASVYLASERTFHTADFISSYDRTLLSADAFRSSLGTGVSTIISSLWTDETLYFTIPLLPVIWAFGDSRSVFVLSIVLLYHLPFVLITGAIAITLMPVYPRAVYWSTAMLGLLVPTIWLPTLLQFPDVGGATLIALALFIHLRFGTLGHFWPGLLIGFLLGSAILFRSHYIYAAVAFLVSIILEWLLGFIFGSGRKTDGASRHVFAFCLRIGLTSVAALLTLMVFGFPFVYRLITFNFPGVYAIYTQSPVHNLAYYGFIYGWLLCSVSIVGFISGVSLRVVDTGKGLFVVLFGVVTLAQWVLLVGQTYPQFTLHFAMFIILGLTSLTWTVYRRMPKRTRLLVLGTGGAFLATNMILSVIPVSSAAETPGRSFFVARHAPVARQDYDEVVRLMNYMRSLVSSGDNIFVAASSDVLNFRTLKAAELKIYGRSGERLRIWPTPDTDSRGWYPLGAIVTSQYVVVANPFRPHWPSEWQKIVRVTHDIFADSEEMARDFIPLPEQFFLEHTTVSIYQRLRPTDVQVSVRALAKMQTQIGRRPRSQLDWMAFGPGYISIAPTSENSYLLKTKQEADDTTVTVRFLYIANLPDALNLTGRVSASAEDVPAVTLRSSCVDQEGLARDSAEGTYIPNDTKEFSLRLRNCNGTYLLLEILRRPKSDAKPYMLHLNPLAVHPVTMEILA